MKRAKLHAVVIAALFAGLTLLALSTALGKPKKPTPSPCSPIPVVATFSDTFELPEATITNDGLGEYIDGADKATVELQAGISCSNDLIINLFGSSPDRYIELNWPSVPCGNSHLDSRSHFMNIDRVYPVPITGGPGFDLDAWDTFCAEEPNPMEGYNLCVEHDPYPDEPDNPIERWVLRRATFYIDEDIKKETYHLRFQATPSMLEEEESSDLASTAYIRVEHFIDDTGNDVWELRPENELDVGEGRTSNQAGVYLMKRGPNEVCGKFVMPFKLTVSPQQQ